MNAGKDAYVNTAGSSPLEHGRQAVNEQTDKVNAAVDAGVRTYRETPGDNLI